MRSTKPVSGTVTIDIGMLQIVTKIGSLILGGIAADFIMSRLPEESISEHCKCKKKDNELDPYDDCGCDHHHK